MVTRSPRVFRKLREELAALSGTRGALTEVMNLDPRLLLPPLVLLAACAPSSSHGSFHGSTTAPLTTAPVASSATPPATPPPVNPPAPPVSATLSLLPDDGVVPLIVVHGYQAEPSRMKGLLDRLAPGRRLVRELYLDEADALPRGSLPRDSVFAFGYYKHAATAPDFDGRSSIGGCPRPRTDGLAGAYPISYAERLRRCVEGVKLATGAKRVDLVGHSMGGLVCRAYAKWLSLDASGASSVRRILLVASPSRGINGLEAAALRFDPRVQTFMLGGEVVEMCYEARVFSGRSFVEELNDGWDAFCAQHDIHYGGLAGTGAPGSQSGFAAKYLKGLTPIQQVALFAAAVFASQAFPQEMQEILSPGDGTIHVWSARLDKAPFARAELYATLEADHVRSNETELGTATSTFSAECARAFCLANGRLPGAPTAAVCDVAAVSSTGHATWIAATVDARDALATELIEENLATKKVKAYGAALRDGPQKILFPVAAGGGQRRYELVLYGVAGPFARSPKRTFTLATGKLEAAPRAALVVTTSASRAHATASSPNALPGDATLRFSWRVDQGPWSAWSASPAFDTPLLGAGHHRVEVVASHSSNAAKVRVDGTVAAAMDLEVDASGVVTIVP